MKIQHAFKDLVIGTCIFGLSLALHTLWAKTTSSSISVNKAKEIRPNVVYDFMETGEAPISQANNS